MIIQFFLAYRTSVYGSTGFSTDTLLSGHESRLPVEMRIPLLPCEVHGHVPRIHYLYTHFADAHPLVRTNLQNARKHQKDVYGRQANGPVYKPGNRVCGSTRNIQQLPPALAIALRRCVYSISYHLYFT